MGLNIWVAVYLTILMIVLIAIGYVGDAYHKSKGGKTTAPQAQKPQEDNSSSES